MTTLPLAEHQEGCDPGGVTIDRKDYRANWPPFRS